MVKCLVFQHDKPSIYNSSPSPNPNLNPNPNHNPNRNIKSPKYAQIIEMLV